MMGLQRGDPRRSLRQERRVWHRRRPENRAANPLAPRTPLQMGPLIAASFSIQSTRNTGFHSEEEL